MKDSIQSKGSEVAIVIYDAPLPPRYFRFSKKFIQTLFVTIPLLLVGSFLLIFLWGLGVRVNQAPKPTMPVVLNETDSKIISLETEINDLQKSNLELSQKLSAGPVATTAEDPYLMGIKKPYGMQNLTAEKKVSLDQFSMTEDLNKVTLKFQIISSSTESKVTGHVMVFMLSASGVMVYPDGANALLGSGIKYSDGEPFSVSRLRPTSADFLHRLSGGKVKFMIYIFSREGDLILIQETESYKVSAKS